MYSCSRVISTASTRSQQGSRRKVLEHRLTHLNFRSGMQASKRSEVMYFEWQMKITCHISSGAVRELM